jgi:hypothetical protein
MIEEIAAYKDQPGVQGDLARELLAIVNDYRSGALSLEEKQELVEDVVRIYQEAAHADGEVAVRWVVAAGSIAIGLV